MTEYARRKPCGQVFGRGFDCRQLHQCAAPRLIACGAVNFFAAFLEGAVILDIGLFIIPAVPLAIGLLSILVLGKIHAKAASIVYYIALGLSVISCLLGLWGNLWLAAWNSDELLVKHLDIAGVIVMGIQLALLIFYRKNVKARRILGLTILATPLLFVMLTYFVGDLLGVEIRDD